MKKGFTLVEIMIVVAILGLLIAIGVPGFLSARNKAREKVCKTNLKSISDNVASYNVNTSFEFDSTNETTSIFNLWPTDPKLNDANSYIRKQLVCPSYATTSTNRDYFVYGLQKKGSCTGHGTEDNWS